MISNRVPIIKRSPGVDFKTLRYLLFSLVGRQFPMIGIWGRTNSALSILSEFTSADFRPMTEGVILQILFEEDGDKTHFTFSVIHPTEDYCRQQEKMGFYNGWGAAFTRLEKILEAMAG